MTYLSLRVRLATVVHGYTDDNQEITDSYDDQEFADKLIALDRVLSATEKYLLVTSPHGRVMYWEYEGGLAALRDRLAAANLVI